MDGYLPWAALGIIGTAVLGLWSYANSIRQRLAEFEVKVAENYTTNPAMDKAIRQLIDAINELKAELRETRREFHNDRRGLKGNH